MFGAQMMGGMPGDVYDEHYRCQSMAVGGKPELEEGNKTRLNIQFPMQFLVENEYTTQRSHVGVQEFVAPEGMCYMPYWLMGHLSLSEGSIVHVRNVTLRKATFVKLQPMTDAFLECSNPRAVLESALRKFSCLTVGDHFPVTYVGHRLEFTVKEMRPDTATSVIETDMEVDFEAPPGHAEREAERKRKAAEEAAAAAGPTAPKGRLGSGTTSAATSNSVMAQLAEERRQRNQKLGLDDKFLPFRGQGQRLDGKGGSPVATAMAGAGAGAGAAVPSPGEGEALQAADADTLMASTPRGVDEEKASPSRAFQGGTYTVSGKRVDAVEDKAAVGARGRGLGSGRALGSGQPRLGEENKFSAVRKQKAFHGTGRTLE